MDVILEASAMVIKKEPGYSESLNMLGKLITENKPDELNQYLGNLCTRFKEIAINDKYDDQTLLAMAIFRESVCVKILLAHGADINYQYDWQLNGTCRVTVLYQACVRYAAGSAEETKSKYLRIIKFILDLGADCNLCDEDQKPPLMYLVDTNNLLPIDKEPRIQEYCDLIQIFINHGADSSFINLNKYVTEPFIGKHCNCLIADFIRGCQPEICFPGMDQLQINGD